MTRCLYKRNFIIKIFIADDIKSEVTFKKKKVSKI